MHRVPGGEEIRAACGLVYGCLQAAVAAQDVPIGHRQAGAAEAAEEFTSLFCVGEDGADSSVVVEVGTEVTDTPEVTYGQVAAAAELPCRTAVAARTGVEVGQESADEEVLRLAPFAQYGAAGGSGRVCSSEVYLETVALPSGTPLLLVAEADLFNAHAAVSLCLEGSFFFR